MLRSVISLATTTALLATGCTTGRAWPRQPIAVATQPLLDHKVATIDVLPLDLQLWAQPGYNIDLAQLREGAEDSIRNAALESLVKRSYAVNAVIDWNGDYAGGNAMEAPAVQATTESLSRYGAAAAQAPATMPVPYLPVRLGASTGADATLYIGGWGYVARPDDHSTADKIVEGVVIGLLVITVVAALYAVLGGGGHSSGGGGGGHSSGGGGHSSGGGGGAHPTGLHAGNATAHGGGASIGGGGAGGGISGGGGGTNVVGAKIGLSRHGFTASRGGSGIHTGRIASNVADAFGHAAQIALEGDWVDDPSLPDDGGESQMYLEMTLVDNHTGFALWHARQIFPGDASKPADTARATRMLLQQLPDRTVVPNTSGYVQLPPTAQ